MDDVSLSSSFSRLGTWEPKSPPQPTVPRTPQRTTLLQRRVKDGENGRGEWTVPPPTKAFLEEEAQQRAAAREEVELDRAQPSSPGGIGSPCRLLRASAKWLYRWPVDQRR